MIGNSPIGVFDSGLGGLTVAKKIFAKLPQESVTFIGDEIHMPYGEKTPDEVQGLALGMCEFLISQNARLIVMACNISSAVALTSARELFPDTSIIGVIEAGVRALMHTSPEGPIGVLATTGTVNTKAYTRTIHQLMPEAEVYEQACPLFVPLVEEGLWDTPQAESVVREYVEPLYARGCRILILGCTHYPYLSETIRRVASDMTLIDPSEETAREAADILLKAGKLSPQHNEPVHTYFTSADTDRFAEFGSKFLGRKIYSVERITWGVDLRKKECQEKTADRTTKYAL